MIKIVKYALLCLLLFPAVRCSAAGDDLEPGDPIAAIDGEPVFFGELNLVLTERLQAKDLQRVGAEVRRATAVLIVRRHLAMKSLEAKGGATLEAMHYWQIDHHNCCDRPQRAHPCSRLKGLLLCLP